MGVFHSIKFRFEISEISRAQWNGTTRYIVLVSRIQKSGTGEKNFVKLKLMRHFSPTDPDNRTGQSGPPSKLVTNIPIRPNRNGPFHLIYQPKFPKFWVEWKAPFEYRIFSVLAPPLCLFQAAGCMWLPWLLFF